MFTAIYRWRLQPGLEQDFVLNWRRITELGITAGSGGSSLFKDAEGCWVAIARWPSREACQHFFEQLERENDASDMQAATRRAVVETFPPQELEAVIDLWVPISTEQPS